MLNKHKHPTRKNTSLPGKNTKPLEEKFISAREIYISAAEMYIPAGEIYISAREMNF